MFAALRRMIGLIKVTETNGLITISGLPGESVATDITATWTASRIAKNIFTRIGKSEVSFNSFFAPDIIYVFQKIIDQKEHRHNIRAMKRVVKLMYENTWLKNTQSSQNDIIDFNQLSQLNVTLLDHQMLFLKLYNDTVPRYMLNGMLVAAGPGAGKTILGYSTSLCLKADVTICIVPKNSVHRVWEDTIKERFKRLPKYWTSLDDAPIPPRQNYYIIHYDYLEKFVDWVKHQSLGKVVILIDESHNFNDLDSNRVKLLVELCKITRSQHILWESGTPVKALGGELAPLFTTIDPLFNEDARRRFAGIYGTAAMKANDILAARLGKLSYKVESSSVIKVDKPIHHRINVTIPNGGEYTLTHIREEIRKFVTERIALYEKNMRHYVREYEDVMSSFAKTRKTKEEKKELDQYRTNIRTIQKGYDPMTMVEIAKFCNHYEKSVIMPTLDTHAKKEFGNIRSIIKYHRLKVQGEALGQIVGRKRAKCVVDLIPHIGMEKIIDTGLKKTLIFTTYVNVVDTCSDYLKKSGYKPLLVYGKTNGELASMVGTFDKDIDANPLIATFASLSTAVPLVMANTMIILNAPFRSYEYDQTIARAFRIGQDAQVYVFDIFLDTGDEPNITTRSLDIMQWSRQQTSEIMDIALPPGFSMESHQKPAMEDWMVIDFLEDVSGCHDIAELLNRPNYTKW